MNIKAVLLVFLLIKCLIENFAHLKTNFCIKSSIKLKIKSKINNDAIEILLINVIKNQWRSSMRDLQLCDRS